MKVSKLNQLTIRLLCVMVLLASQAVSVVTADELPKDNTSVTSGDEIELPPIYSWYWDSSSGRIKTDDRTKLWTLQRQNRKIKEGQNHRSADKPEERDMDGVKPDITITEGKLFANGSNIILASPTCNKNRLSLASLGSIYAEKFLRYELSKTTFGERPNPKSFRSVGQSRFTRQGRPVIQKNRSGNQFGEVNFYEKYPDQNDGAPKDPPTLEDLLSTGPFNP